MASVFNSRNTTVNLNTDTSFTGKWEDIQAYTSVINTLDVGTDTSGTVTLQWINMDDDNVPAVDATALVTDSYAFGANQVVTKQFDTRTRWFRLYVTGAGASLNQISTNYKKAPTEIKLSDDTTHIVSVNLGDTKNSLYTILSDTSGAFLGTTNDAHTGEALYTHLADGSGSSLATTNNNRDIARTLTTADVSFVFSTDGESTGNYGSFIVERNRLRLPKSTIPFKDGDIVRFAMGGLGSTDFSVNSAFSSPATPAGVLKATGTVRYREVESSHVQFELLVDKDMSEWFDPTVGFTNFDVSQFTDYDTMSSANYTSAVGSSGYAYLHDVSNGSVPTVDTFYAAFADVSGFNVSGAGLSLNPGQYPVDLRFWRGSLASDSSNVRIMSFDLSLANDPLESLTVALRDNNNENITSTGAGTTNYYYHSTRHANTNILFMVDVCFVSTNSLLDDFMNGARKIALDMEGSMGTPITTAVAGYGDGIAYPVFTNAGLAPSHVKFSVLKPLDTCTSNWGNYTNDVTTNTGNGTANYWKALTDYANSEYTDTCLGSIFSSNLDAIVLFNYGDSSASQADRIGFDACSNFFDGIDKIVVTSADKDVTELLSFAGYTDNIYRFPNNAATFNDVCGGFRETLGKRLGGIKHIGHNALNVHTTDACGHSQASTLPIANAEHGDVALYYALADSCGTQLDTTKSNTSNTSLNALYVSLVTKVNAQGTALSAPSTVNSNRPLHITFDAAFSQGKTFDLTVSGYPVTIADLSNNNVNLMHLGIANETAAPIWLKIYDMSVGFYNDNSAAVLNTTTGNYDSSAYALKNNLVYNIAVPGLDYRDLEFLKGVKFNNGVYMVASTNYRYDTYNFPPGNKHIFVHGSYEDIAAT